MPDLLTLPHLLDPQARTCRAIIETPRGARHKYDYEAESGLFVLHGVLPAGISFPLAFGFVPGTLAQDGDPVDILVMADEDLPMGCMATARLLGVIEANQTQDGHTCRNDRLIARVAESRFYADVNDLECMGGAMVEELGRFFETFNALKGKRFDILGIGGPDRACVLVAEATLARA